MSVDGTFQDFATNKDNLSIQLEGTSINCHGFVAAVKITVNRHWACIDGADRVLHEPERQEGPFWSRLAWSCGGTESVLYPTHLSR